MSFWGGVDWQRPWLAPYRALGERACDRLEQGDSAAQALNALVTHGGGTIALAAGPLRFVDPAELPGGEAYEAFIHRSARVPTRDTLHDLFNGLVWRRFPAVKRRLNELQAEQIAQAGVAATRGAVRDALTLFDENGALWQAPPQLVEALRVRDWSALFLAQRSAWTDARPVLFGHALLEKLTQARKAITAHACVIPPGPDLSSQLLAGLTPAWLASKPFLPMPVLGVPGWWPPNEVHGFYDDASVFRPSAGAGPPPHGG